ncbi:hypothetical protein HYALB_00002507 [Hymenoscyphus albidus]|uniref:Uncharacterized protein n=1 Tax=Hymenoscyphus albidus TaxID=595503 RepID=A0A9N9Q9V0_9HELO|nr:hypothetical protein HYALB_00002507 [Hymenoscyphus albidus]
MAPYSALQQADNDHDSDHESITSSSPNRGHREPVASPVFAPPISASRGLFLDQDSNGQAPSASRPATSSGLGAIVQAIRSRGNTATSYGVVEGEDFAIDAPSSPTFSWEKHKGSSPGETIARPIPRNRISPSATTADNPLAPAKSSAAPASIVSTALRHPTPDLQTLQGAYTENIEHLERTAERLSMTSSIDVAIKNLHDEQKRSDSRKASMISAPDRTGLQRHRSNASSIVDVNSTARSGGYSPAGFMMSPKGSMTTNRMRSASKGSRYGTRPEPEMEGRPLDSFVNRSIDERDEDNNTLTKPVVDQIDRSDIAPKGSKQTKDDRPPSPTSTYTVDQSEMFEGFDGVHTEPLPPPPPPQSEYFHEIKFDDPYEPEAFQPGQQNQQMRTASGNVLTMADNSQRRASTGNRLSMPRPQSYADPNTGQNMVYYPAPVPMMLNLPQKLSKQPSSMARNKRRSQVMSSIPPAARQSAIWLPDVLEDDHPTLAADEGVQAQEYLPQHQRATMGGRRNTQDLAHIPPQLRASAYFDVPAPAQSVEMKGQSAVATLDSILDASAYAPVSAFTDHSFAGHLGSEVYGKHKNRNSINGAQLLDGEQKKRSSVSSSHMLLDSTHKRRTSSFNLLRGKRMSGATFLTDQEQKRSSTFSGLDMFKTDLGDDDTKSNGTRPLSGTQHGDEIIRASGDEVDGEEQEGEDDESSDEDEDDVYFGPPTTLLAELQLRKQQQKLRTQLPEDAYTSGMHSTLLQIDAVKEVEQKSRQRKRVNLAWEDPASRRPEEGADSDDDDVPLAVLYSKRAQELNRPIGLLERREMEDNEPLSRRRDRIHGVRPAPARAPIILPPEGEDVSEEEGETIAQRMRRLKEKKEVKEGALPAPRTISGDFASEMMSQFGGNPIDAKAKGKEKEKSPAPNPEDETLGQRRKRLQAEALANGSPKVNKRHSMADILQAHPQAGGNTQLHSKKPSVGLLGLHDMHTSGRSSTMLNLNSRAPSGGFKNGMFNDGQAGAAQPPPQPQQPQYPNIYNGYPNAPPPFAQPSLGYNPYGQQGMMPFANPYAAMEMNGMNMNMNFMGGMGNMQPNPMMGMNAMQEPLNQGQIDMVERWRQSVMQ